MVDAARVDVEPAPKEVCLESVIRSIQTDGWLLGQVTEIGSQVSADCAPIVEVASVKTRQRSGNAGRKLRVRLLHMTGQRVGVEFAWKSRDIWRKKWIQGVGRSKGAIETEVKSNKLYGIKSNRIMRSKRPAVDQRRRRDCKQRRRWRNGQPGKEAPSGRGCARLDGQILQPERLDKSV